MPSPKFLLITAKVWRVVILFIKNDHLMLFISTFNV